ncbi:sulfite exporter TauE/SafE family protein [Microbulbifer sp. A4B17]|uniref:sulfite exporter TauE/SafE family protein n=1 Tax=Microbulbifer sp. A4B17 TaxID=359370 RepID=UPI000D52C694|nr:sulfite exporter TauE/SafE family protein [Microbulbifer sp. A4B17]AWF82273.1 sulfite exporter TauE/SafE family protein [Microbulbifer sp. A4B17]
MALEIAIAGLLLILIAGMAHGALGFGFPMLATPILALAYDLKTAVVLTILPSLLIIVSSLYSCRDYRADITKYGLVILLVSVGSLSGAWLLTWANPDVLKLFLAVSILVYLFSNRLRVQLSRFSSRPVLFPVIVGGLAGVIGGATNAIAPLLMIYLLEVSKSSKEVILISNICFLIGKLLQLAVLSLYLSFDDLELVSLSTITVFAYLGLVLGFRIQSRIDEERYRTIIRYALSIFMCVLTYQGVSNLIFFDGVIA